MGTKGSTLTKRSTIALDIAIDVTELKVLPFSDKQ